MSGNVLQAYTRGATLSEAAAPKAIKETRWTITNPLKSIFCESHRLLHCLQLVNVTFRFLFLLLVWCIRLKFGAFGHKISKSVCSFISKEVGVFGVESSYCKECKLITRQPANFFQIYWIPFSVLWKYALKETYFVCSIQVRRYKVKGSVKQQTNSTRMLQPSVHA